MRSTEILLLEEKEKSVSPRGEGLYGELWHQCRMRTMTRRISFFFILAHSNSAPKKQTFFHRRKKPTAPGQHCERTRAVVSSPKTTHSLLSAGALNWICFDFASDRPHRHIVSAVIWEGRCWQNCDLMEDKTLSYRQNQCTSKKKKTWLVFPHCSRMMKTIPFTAVAPRRRLPLHYLCVCVCREWLLNSCTVQLLGCDLQSTVAKSLYSFNFNVIHWYISLNA